MPHIKNVGEGTSAGERSEPSDYNRSPADAGNGSRKPITAVVLNPIVIVIVEGNTVTLSFQIPQKP